MDLDLALWIAFIVAVASTVLIVVGAAIFVLFGGLGLGLYISVIVLSGVAGVIFGRDYR